MKLVANWQNAWKWASIQAAGLLVVLIGIQPVLEKFDVQFATATWWHYLKFAIALLVPILRLVPQPKSNPTPTPEIQMPAPAPAASPPVQIPDWLLEFGRAALLLRPHPITDIQDSSPHQPQESAMNAVWTEVLNDALPQLFNLAKALAPAHATVLDQAAAVTAAATQTIPEVAAQAKTQDGAAKVQTYVAAAGLIASFFEAFLQRNPAPIAATPAPTPAPLG